MVDKVLVWLSVGYRQARFPRAFYTIILAFLLLPNRIPLAPKMGLEPILLRHL